MATRFGSAEVLDQLSIDCPELAADLAAVYSARGMVDGRQLRSAAPKGRHLNSSTIPRR